MDYNEIRAIIVADKINNIHPKNRLFIFLFRWGGYFHKKKSEKFRYRILDIIFRFLVKIFINKNNHYPLAIQIGEGLRLPHNIGIVLSGNAIIGKNCTIFHQVTIGVDDTKNNGKAPIIGDNVFIGAGAKLIGGITIGDNVKIGANAIVTKDVPSNSTVINTNQILSKI